MRYLNSILLIFIFFFSSFCANSQDILGGEINVTHISGLTYNISIFLYTKTSIGGNDSIIEVTNDSFIFFLSGTSTNLVNDVTEWEYSFTNTYLTSGTYSITVKDSFRITNITNITNSSTEKIFLQKDIIINPFWGANSSPILQSKPTSIFINGSNFFYNLNATDPDNDSLSYSLVPVSASNYSFPTGALIDSITGTFTMPGAFGSYAIGIKIDEWRVGVNIGTTVREMIIDSNLITSIKIEGEIGNIKIFPNPNSGLFKIELNGINGRVEVSIFNIVGEQIFSKNQNGSNILNVDISNQSKGIYLLKIINGNDVITKKIIYN